MITDVCIGNWLPHEHVITQDPDGILWHCIVDGCRYFILHDHLELRRLVTTEEQ